MDPDLHRDDDFEDIDPTNRKFLNIKPKKRIRKNQQQKTNNKKRIIKKLKTKKTNRKEKQATKKGL